MSDNSQVNSETNPTVQKFNSMATTFAVFGKVVEKYVISGDNSDSLSLICPLADILIKEIQDIKNSFNCPIE